MDENGESSAGSAKTCDKCGEKFAKARKLRMHMHKVHANTLVSEDDFASHDLYQKPKKI